MATLARVLMLVACVPLLQPPGFCICKTAARARARAVTLAPVKAEAPHAPSSDCGCRQCKIGQPPTHSTESSEPSTPTPTPDESHLPGCPASPGVDRFKWVEPVQSLVHDLPSVEVLTFLHIEVVGPAALPSRTPATWPSSPPFYLSHCSLVI